MTAIVFANRDERAADHDGQSMLRQADLRRMRVASRDAHRERHLPAVT